MESAAAAWSRGLYRPIRAFCHWASPLHLLLAPFSSMTDIFVHSKTCIAPFKVTRPTQKRSQLQCGQKVGFQMT